MVNSSLLEFYKNPPPPLDVPIRHGIILWFVLALSA